MSDHPLKTLRQSRGLTQTQLAELAGISQASVARIEADGHIAAGTTLLKVSQALGVPLLNICGDRQRNLAKLLAGRELASHWLGVGPDSPEVTKLHYELAA